MSLLITNCALCLEEGLAVGSELVVEGDRIARIRPAGGPRAGLEVVDCAGGIVCPGLIDIHSDYIEHMAAPRPTSLMDFGISLREAEKELAGHGVTTMFHSLSLYKATEFPDKPIRRPENVSRFIDLVDKAHRGSHLIRHRFHARFELDNIERVDELAGYIRAGKIQLLSFMDHTPGQGQYRDLEVFRKTLKGYVSASDEVIDRMIADSQAKEKLTLAGIAALARAAKERGIAVASHDDDSAEKVALVRSYGATISEFPVAMDGARAARDAGMHIVAGAPNILLGGSHSGNLSAADAIEEGLVDVLCSDYYPAAMLHSVFAMHRARGKDLAAMMRLVTINPARAVGMDAELGSIAEGKKADLLVLRELEDGFPAIEECVVDGRRILSTRYRPGREER